MDREQLQKTIIWSALFFSNFIYLGIVLAFPIDTATVPVDGLPLQYVYFVIGVFMLALSFVIPNFLKKIANPHQSVSSKEITSFILGLALNESASIFAFIIAFTLNERMMSFALFALSLLCFILRFPKKIETTKTKASRLDVD